LGRFQFWGGFGFGGLVPGGRRPAGRKAPPSGPPPPPPVFTSPAPPSRQTKQGPQTGAHGRPAPSCSSAGFAPYRKGTIWGGGVWRRGG
jgi:hypothetical protein